MRLKRDGSGTHPSWHRWAEDRWELAAEGDVPAFMQHSPDFPAEPALAATAPLPFQPRSFRDAVLFYAHWVQSSRQYARRFLPWTVPITRTFEALTGRDYPAFRPGRLWFEQPIYYFGNHTSFVPSGTPVAIPPFTQAFDFELELGWIVGKRLRDASVEEAEEAIFGFVVVNDFSARDVQRSEMQTGLGPQKSKHCISSMSTSIVTADEVLPHIDDLAGIVEINGERVSTTSTRGMRHSPAQVLSFLSRSETLWPGELVATGTLPFGCGLELGRLLRSGDHLRLGIERIGEIEHEIV